MAHRIAIIGHAAEKFTRHTELKAKMLIQDILMDEYDSDADLHDSAPILVSGRSPMGGIDVWAEEIAIRLNLNRKIFPPKKHHWEAFKQRNLEIARSCDKMFVIVVEDFPPEFRGKRFRDCYHCRERLDSGMNKHIKSGACWTANKAIGLGVDVNWFIIRDKDVKTYIG